MAKSSLTNHTLLFHMLILSLLWCYHLLDPEYLFYLYGHNIYHSTRHAVSVRWVFVDWFTANEFTTFSRMQCRLLTLTLRTFCFLPVLSGNGDDWLPKSLCPWKCWACHFIDSLCFLLIGLRIRFIIKVVESNLYFSLPHIRCMYKQNQFQGSMKHKLNRTMSLASTSVDWDKTKFT